MNRSKIAFLRRTWLIIFGYWVGAVVLCVSLCFLVPNPSKQLPRSADLITLSPILIVVSVGGLLAATAWLRFKVDGKLGATGRPLALSPVKFQIDSMMALALSQVCTFCGFTMFRMGGSSSQFAVFALGTLFVDFAFILPRGLRYWAAYEKSAALHSTS